MTTKLHPLTQPQPDWQGVAQRSRLIGGFEGGNFSEHPQPGFRCASGPERSNRARANLVAQVAGSIAGQAGQLCGGERSAVNAPQPRVQEKC